MMLKATQYGIQWVGGPTVHSTIVVTMDTHPHFMHCENSGWKPWMTIRLPSSHPQISHIKRRSDSCSKWEDSTVRCKTSRPVGETPSPPALLTATYQAKNTLRWVVSTKQLLRLVSADFVDRSSPKSSTVGGRRGAS